VLKERGERHPKTRPLSSSELSDAVGRAKYVGETSKIVHLSD
jgi:hypothetical protein